MSWIDDLVASLSGIPKAVQDGFDSMLGIDPEVRDLFETRQPGGRDRGLEVAEKLQAGLTFRSYSMMYAASLGVVEFIRLNDARLARDFAVLKSKIGSIPFERFREAWKIARQLIGLQGRLVMEQAFWDLGPPWKTLYTGFKAIGDTSIPGSGEDGGATSTTITNADDDERVPESGGGPPPPAPPRWIRPKEF